MSLLLPDTLSLYITSRGVQAVKRAGLRQRPAEVHQRAIAVHAEDNWKGLVGVCTDLIRKTQAQRVQVVLSDNLVRYACFPWRADLHNTQEEISLAQLKFDDVYGPHAHMEWHIALSAGRPGQSRLSVAMPASLFAVLQANFGMPQPKVLSVQTAFTGVLQNYRRELDDAGWLVNLEEGRVTLGSWTGAEWNWVYSVHAELQSPKELLQRIRQEIKMSSISLKADRPLSIYLHAPTMEHMPFGTMDGVRFVQLKTPNKEVGSQYAYSLLGAGA